MLPQTLALWVSEHNRTRVQRHITLNYGNIFYTRENRRNVSRNSTARRPPPFTIALTLRVGTSEGPVFEIQSLRSGAQVPAAVEDRDWTAETRALPLPPPVHCDRTTARAKGPVGPRWVIFFSRSDGTYLWVKLAGRAHCTEWPRLWCCVGMIIDDNNNNDITITTIYITNIHFHTIAGNGRVWEQKFKNENLRCFAFTADNEKRAWRTRRLQRDYCWLGSARWQPVRRNLM